ncbi:X antigen family member 3-like [Nycticebus coucang]|uniref:X antigen family member 3-like n=1 Tax=Nycticebus coucang TaxID=9470 RepID=UPI00234DB364|nr:X antigen family member 3-like [Nycticebus coucang]
MSFRGRSTYRPRARRNDQPSSHLVVPVVQPEPDDEQGQQDEPSTGVQDITPRLGRNEGASGVQGPEAQSAIQELSEPKTGRERGDGPDVKGKQPLNPEHIKQLEAGEGQP